MLEVNNMGRKIVTFTMEFYSKFMYKTDMVKKESLISGEK